MAFHEEILYLVIMLIQGGSYYIKTLESGIVHLVIPARKLQPSSTLMAFLENIILSECVSEYASFKSRYISNSTFALCL